MTPTTNLNPRGPFPHIMGLEERVRQRAYELYEGRGRQHGHDREDWLQAEADFLGTKKTAIGTDRKAAAA
jgi:hypothetical protein